MGVTYAFISAPLPGHSFPVSLSSPVLLANPPSYFDSVVSPSRLLVICFFSLFPTLPHPAPSLPLSLSQVGPFCFCQGAGCCQGAMALPSPRTQTEAKRPAKPKALNSRTPRDSVPFLSPSAQTQAQTDTRAHIHVQKDVVKHAGHKRERVMTEKPKKQTSSYGPFGSSGSTMVCTLYMLKQTHVVLLDCRFKKGLY